MKYAQLAIGLLVGTALGGSVIAATGAGPAKGGAVDAEAVKAIVRQTIMDEPKLIMDSVQKYQKDLHDKDAQGASDALKDPAVREAVFNPKVAASFGPKDSKKVIVEFFDYNCPVCKMQYKFMNELRAKDKDVRIVLREFPIFGPSSDLNSHVGLAIWQNHPEKYEAYFTKMIALPGHGDAKEMLRIVKELGLDIEKLKAEGDTPEINAILAENKALGEKLHIQGTPTLVVGDEVIPHAASADELYTRLNAPAK